ncbi:MAG: diguanylate cyclase, partial [Pseudomonadota bacterium]
AKEHSSHVGLLVADIDDFKRFNDTAGHVAGDECLREVARQFQTCCVRSQDETVLARYGGEEFVVLLPCTDATKARALAERLRQHLEACAIPHPNSRVADNVTVSVGVATIKPRPGLEPTSLFGAADLALYRAKSAGRNCAAGDEPPAEVSYP